MKLFCTVLALMGVAALAPQSTAQLPTNELRLWLKADSLNLAEDAPVAQWVDSSPHGTIFAPRTLSNPAGPLAGAPVEERPHLRTVVVNGKSFPTVQFERSGDILNGGNPNVDRSGSVDRLFQTTNLAPGSDPLALGDGASVASFTVLKPDVTFPSSLGFQSVWALRGNSASLLELGIAGGNADTAGRFNYVTYDSVTSYVAATGPGTSPQPAGKWHIVYQSIVESGANDLLTFSANSAEDASSPLAPLVPVTNNHRIANRNDAINEDPAGRLEPFVIGGHAQDCCGEGETFSGNIAEIIIYGRRLTQPEIDQVYSYLTAKYLTPPMAGLPGDYNENNVVDASDYVVWRDNYGQFFGLPNENPEAETEGFVDDEDYEFWRQRYGMSLGGAVAGGASSGTSSIAGRSGGDAIPEPGSAGAAIAAGWLFASCPLFRRRCHRALKRGQ